MTAPTTIWCCSCCRDVPAHRVRGADIYPGRPELAEKPIWQCPFCGCYVGCHPGTEHPLGSIPTPELRRARGFVHRVLDPIWKQGVLPRGKVYAEMSRRLGSPYHTGDLRTITQARLAYRAALEISKGAYGGGARDALTPAADSAGPAGHSRSAPT